MTPEFVLKNAIRVAPRDFKSPVRAEGIHDHNFVRELHALQTSGNHGFLVAARNDHA